MRSPRGKGEEGPGWSPGEWFKVRSQTQGGTPKEKEREHVGKWKEIRREGNPRGRWRRRVVTDQA